MKKLLLLTATGLIIQATPILADHHKGDQGKMFEMHDTNGDGMISESEFLDHAKKKFTEKDVNGDGSISKDEAKAAYEAKREKRKAMKDKIKDRMKDKREERLENSAE